MRRLLLGIMSATGFLSVWISNTATATMIYPIVISIVEQLVILNPEFSHEDHESSRKILGKPDSERICFSRPEMKLLNSL